MICSCCCCVPECGEDDDSDGRGVVVDFVGGLYVVDGKGGNLVPEPLPLKFPAPAAPAIAETPARPVPLFALSTGTCNGFRAFKAAREEGPDIVEATELLEDISPFSELDSIAFASTFLEEVVMPFFFFFF